MFNKTKIKNLEKRIKLLEETVRSLEDAVSMPIYRPYYSMRYAVNDIVKMMLDKLELELTFIPGTPDTLKVVHKKVGEYGG